MATYNFSGGVAPVESFGQKVKIRFIGTWGAGPVWEANDTWTIPITATLSGNFTVGKGNIAGQIVTCGIKFRNRMIVGMSNNFALSSNGDPTLWEEQDPGAAVINFLSQAGPQDEVNGFASVQGRVAVIGNQTTQIWTIDADPGQLILQQVMENTGTLWPLSVKSIGDLDALYLDFSGIRSIRAKESTLNASINDIGTAIDLTVRPAIVTNGNNPVCAIVDPTTKQYWLSLNGDVYVLSNYPESKITAWSTFKTTVQETVDPVSPNYDLAGEAVYTGIVVGDSYYWTKGAFDISLLNDPTVYTATTGFVATDTSLYATGVSTSAITATLVHVNRAFTPEKMIVYNGQIYMRATTGEVFYYGGSDANSYDMSKLTIETPWLDLKKPSMRKQSLGMDVAFKGAWVVQASMNPRASSMVTVIQQGSAVSPSFIIDSTFDTGHYNYSANGTHVKFRLVSEYVPYNVKLSKMTWLYDPSNTK